jgi:hypothetical protein
MEGTLVPVLLEEFLLPLWFLFSCFLRSFHIFPKPLFFWQRSPSLYFFSFYLTSNLFFLISFDSSEFAQPPGFEFCVGIESVCIVNIGYLFFFLLYM